MHLDLIANERLVGKLDRLLEESDREIRDADVAGKPHAFDLAQSGNRLAQRDLRIGPM